MEYALILSALDLKKIENKYILNVEIDIVTINYKIVLLCRYNL